MAADQLLSLSVAPTARWRLAEGAAVCVSYVDSCFPKLAKPDSVRSRVTASPSWGEREREHLERDVKTNKKSRSHSELGSAACQPSQPKLGPVP